MSSLEVYYTGYNQAETHNRSEVLVKQKLRLNHVVP